MQSSPGHIGFYGKIPAHPDFVRYNASGAAWKSFNQWFYEGLTYASRDTAFNDAYTTASGYAFTFTESSPPSRLIGYIYPSQDKVGRSFPLIFALEVHEQVQVDMGISELLRKYATQMHRLHHIAQQAAKGAFTKDELVQEIAEIPLDGEHTVSPQHMLLHTFLERTKPRLDNQTIHLLFLNVIELLNPLRESVPGHYTVGYRFPAIQGSTLMDAGSAEWAALTEGFLRKAVISPICFWRLDGLDTFSLSSLLVFFRQPPPKVLIDIFPKEKESDYIYDVTTANKRKKDQAASLLPVAIKDVLNAKDATIGDMAHLLSGI